MMKFLPVALIVVVIVGGLLYFRFFRQVQNLSKPVVDRTTSTELLQNEISNADSVEEKEQILEAAILDLAKQLGNLKAVVERQTPIASGSANVEIAALQAKVDSLQQQIKQLPTTTTSTSTTTSKSPRYIPLGSGGDPIGDRNWFLVDGYQVVINSADYPGYSSIQLEISLKLSQNVGTANAQLFNVIDHVAVSSTQVSTTSSTSYTLLSSGNGQLAAGTKTYQLQIQATEGYPVYYQGARIKINF